jgi:hypothetical protein
MMIFFLLKNFIFNLKILSLAIFIAFFTRNTNDDKEAVEYMDVDNLELDDEKELHSIEVCLVFYLIKN